MPCHETNGFTYNEDGSRQRSYVVWDVHDDVQAVALAFAQAPPDITHNQVRTHARADNPSVRLMGWGMWEVVFTYSPVQVGDLPGGTDTVTMLRDGVLTFSAQAVNAHVTQAISQKAYGSENASQLEESRVIGTTGDSVEGADTRVPQLTFSLQKIPPIVNGQYIANLARLCGRTNVAPYILRGWVQGVNIFITIQFAAGELMFTNAEPSNNIFFKYDFEASENRTDIKIKEDTTNGTPPITVAEKKGFDYLWTMYDHTELTKPKVRIPVPRIAVVSQIANTANFIEVLGF